MTLKIPALPKMLMNKTEILKYDSLLFLAAAIWGFAFVGQRVAMEYMGPLTFNGIRFAMASMILIPLLLKKDKPVVCGPDTLQLPGKLALRYGGVIAGFILFLAAWLQQAGLQYTTAGKAGFITGLYVVIVPLYGLLGKRKASAGTWTGGLLAAVGLYFLSVTETLTISEGDLLELAGAFMWAAHVMAIGWLSPRTATAPLAFTQFITCSLCSLAAGAPGEEITLQAIRSAWLPLFYCGFLSAGLGYTLQIAAQQKAHPAHAAVILSLEAAVAAAGGCLLLGESLTLRGIAGCALMLGGVMISQLSAIRSREAI